MRGRRRAGCPSQPAVAELVSALPPLEARPKPTAPSRPLRETARRRGQGITLPDRRGGAFVEPAPLAQLGGLPRTLIQVGSEEVLLSDSLRFANALQAAQVSVSCEVYDDLWHDFQMQIGLLPDATRAVDRIRRFLDIDMGDLSERMHPRVGAARALDQTFFLCESIHSVLERHLHGLAI